MHAILYDRYGAAKDVIYQGQLPKPDPRPGFARIRVHACALNPKDVLIRKGKMRWLSPGGFPRCSGYDFAGELIDDTSDLSKGCRVFGMIQNNQGRACAEVISVPVTQFTKTPDTLSDEEAAAIPLAALTALQALRDRLKLSTGHKVLLNGASGGVGTFAVQIARAMELEVTAVCSSRNTELVHSLGAQKVIAYDKEDILALREQASIFDIYGNLTWSKARHMLIPKGTYCTTVPGPSSIIQGTLARLGIHRAELVVVRSNRKDLDMLARWVQKGLLTPHIDQIYPMNQAVQAHEHLETRRTRGKVVITMQEA